ncbi:MAG TPA: glycoside hydrolase family 97 N-terminal domain-containing protein, partial [Flavobacterium sp.]|nr:glycoside hydrolase family 97 N-terminal domain-containing protein [Flavobacterium sp.]
MTKMILLSLVLGTSFLHGQTMQSPSKNLSMTFNLSAGGAPNYTLQYKDRPVAEQSTLGIAIKDAAALQQGFQIINSRQSEFNESWKPVLGEQSSITNHYKQLTVELSQKDSGRKMNLVFRLFDDGLAFRYEFPQQEKLNYFIVSRELTEFNLAGDHKAFWIPGDFDSQEYEYNESKLSAVDVTKINMDNGIAFKGPMVKTRVQSPLMMKTNDNLYINIFEAAVVNYPVMHLLLNPQTFTLTSELAPDAVGNLAYLQAPYNT